MRRLFQWNNVKNIGFLMVLGIGVQAFAGTEFEYFGSTIDFWNKKEAKTNEKSRPEPSGFPWQKYLDPNNKEFFREGEYTPPEPFMEVVRNPSDSNLKLWFSYIDKKNELTRRLQERTKEYLAKNSPAVEPAGQDSVNQKLASIPVLAPDAKRYRFRMYFDSHCPHCRKMFDTLTDLQSWGFYVEAKQVDSDPRGMEGVGIPTTRATSEELQQKDIQSVPVLFIGDLKTKEVYRLAGYQSPASVFAALQGAGR